MFPLHDLDGHLARNPHQLPGPRVRHHRDAKLRLTPRHRPTVLQCERPRAPMQRSIHTLHGHIPGRPRNLRAHAQHLPRTGRLQPSKKPFLERHSPKLRHLRLLVVRLLQIHLHLKCPVRLDRHERSLFSGLTTCQPVRMSSPPQITVTLVAMIGKTRQPSPAQIEEVFDSEVGRARGILRRPLPAGKLGHARRSPPPDLAYWIAHYWMITWDLRGLAPHIAETLPHPNIHVVFEKDGSVVS